jgi:hypothetical protein
MRSRGISTHGEMATVLGVDRTLVSKYLSNDLTVLAAGLYWDPKVLAHELATAWLRRRDTGVRVSMDDLPFRAHVGDLFDLGRRPVLPSVTTPTIRRGPEGDPFFLHRRGAGRVAVAAGQSHVIPAGVFQPSGIASWNMAGDAEGDIYPSDPGAVGIGWTSANIRRVLADEPLACSAASGIALTWKHRRVLLE